MHNNKYMCANVSNVYPLRKAQKSVRHGKCCFEGCSFICRKCLKCDDNDGEIITEDSMPKVKLAISIITTEILANTH